MYRRKDGDASTDDAARAVKHGAIVGALRDWGYGTIERIDVPSGSMKLDDARLFVEGLVARLTESSPEGSEILRPIWVDLKTRDRLVLIEAVF